MQRIALDRPTLVAITAGTLCTLFPTAAAAYVGPGLGVGVIGAVIGVASALALALAGAVWYPLKRWRLRRREAPPETETEAAERQ